MYQSLVINFKIYWKDNEEEGKMKETIINVEGMVCGGCENRVVNALKDIDGVESVIANHENGKVTVTSNGDINMGVIKEKIEDLGFEVKE